MKTFIRYLCTFYIVSQCGESINPGKRLRTYGIEVDVTRLLDRMHYALHAVENYPGIQIRTYSGHCIDVATSDAGDYSPHVARCNANSETQRWRLWNRVLKVAHRTVLPNITSQIPCMDCTSGAEDCYLEVNGCTASTASQQFFIRVHDRQIDLVRRRIYFSIHSGLHRRRCLTRYESTDKGLQTYVLDRCSGSRKQSFYIQQDYTNELDRISNRIRLCSSGADASVSDTAGIIQSYARNDSFIIES